jgi:hypothetical protein
MVLRQLYRAEKPMTGRAIERAIGLSNRATMNALEVLVDARAVHKVEEPHRYLFTINMDHYFIKKALRPAFDAEELFWADLAKTIQRIVRPRPIAAVATGPLAREETFYGGRITLTMLFDKKTDRIRSLSSVSRLSEQIRERYDLSMEHHLLDMNTMDRKEYEPLWRRVENEGILLFGALP